MLYTILEQWQPFLVVFVLLLFWVWESISPFFSRERRLKHAGRNLTIAILNAVMLVFVFAGLTVIVCDFATSHRIGLLYWFGLPELGHAAFAFLLYDVWIYWWHRFNHMVPFLWRFHRTHHSDPEVDVTTATRFHLGEIVFSSIIRLVLIPVVGIPLGVLILFDVIQLPIISFHHANIQVKAALDRFLRYLIVTPFMHKVHHSRIKDEIDSNFSSLLSVWDRLFGSYVEKEDYREIRFGLDGYDGDDRQSVKGLLTTPLVQQ
jgi:sterol desaturase/sphingolipid hydroxylase (fatty acid hydroxylase superfamily)